MQAEAERAIPRPYAMRPYVTGSVGVLRTVAAVTA